MPIKGGNWLVTTLKDCADWYSGGTPSTSVAEYWNGDIPWITASSLHNFYIRDSERRVTSLGLANGTRLMPKNTILFVVRGMSLKTEFRIGITRRPMAFGQDCKALIAKDGIDPLFLANVLRAKAEEILGLTDEASHGTGRLATDAIQSVEVLLPPIAEQKAIAQILSALDDKIELNRQMNHTLESIARALFKSWFIDFDPVRAKLNGQPPAGMDAETAALFPDAFEDSPLGKIPKGWKIQKLVEATSKIGSGATPRGGSQVYVDEGIALIRSQNVYDYEFNWDGLARMTEETAEQLRNVIVEPNDILLNITGDSILRTCVVEPSVLPARVNQHVAIIRAIPEIPCRYLHLYLVHPQMKSLLLGFDTGATRKAVTKGQLESVPVPVPSEAILLCFRKTTDPLFEQINSNLAESRILTSIRDALLPKLLSGEIRVKDVEKIVEEVT